MCGLLLLLVKPVLAADSPNAPDNEQPDYSAQINAQGFFYGFFLGASNEIYKGYGTRLIPYPLIGYKGDKLNVYGPFVSYDILSSNGATFYFQLSPRFAGYDESDSSIFQGMAERKNSIDAGFGLKLEYNNWTLKGSTLSELLSYSDGTEIEASISRSFRAGPFLIEPQLYSSYLSNDHVNYYYGVRASEANQFRQAYRGVHALNHAIGLSIATPVLFGGMTRLIIEHNLIDTPISNSPLVDSDTSTSLKLIFSKFF